MVYLFGLRISTKPEDCPFGVRAMIVQQTHDFRLTCCKKIVRPLQGSRADSAARTNSIESLRGLCGDCTEIAQFSCDLRAASVRICPDQSHDSSYKIRTISVYNVNIVHKRRIPQQPTIPENRKENRRRCYRLAHVVNVNHA